MPGLVTKGYVIRKIDAVMNDLSPGGGREEFLRRLKHRRPDRSFSETLLEILSDGALFDLRPADKRHLREHWFKRDDGYWPRLQPIDIVIRHGLIQAMELADAPPQGGARLPTDLYWVCAGGTIEVSSCVGPAQVTALVMTPPPPVPDRLPELFVGWSNLDPIYTARPTQRGPGEHEVKLPEDFVEFVQPKAEVVS
jgi:hypothetical protein